MDIHQHRSPAIGTNPIQASFSNHQTCTFSSDFQKANFANHLELSVPPSQENARISQTVRQRPRNQQGQMQAGMANSHMQPTCNINQKVIQYNLQVNKVSAIHAPNNQPTTSRHGLFSNTSSTQYGDQQFYANQQVNMVSNEQPPSTLGTADIEIVINQLTVTQGSNNRFNNLQQHQRAAQPTNNQFVNMRNSNNLHFTNQSQNNQHQTNHGPPRQHRTVASSHTPVSYFQSQPQNNARMPINPQNNQQGQVSQWNEHQGYSRQHSQSNQLLQNNPANVNYLPTSGGVSLPQRHVMSMQANYQTNVQQNYTRPVRQQLRTHLTQHQNVNAEIQKAGRTFSNIETPPQNVNLFSNPNLHTNQSRQAANQTCTKEDKQSYKHLRGQKISVARDVVAADKLVASNPRPKSPELRPFVDLNKITNGENMGLAKDDSTVRVPILSQLLRQINHDAMQKGPNVPLKPFVPNHGCTPNSNQDKVKEVQSNQPTTESSSGIPGSQATYIPRLPKTPRASKIIPQRRPSNKLATLELAKEHQMKPQQAPSETNALLTPGQIQAFDQLLYGSNNTQPRQTGSNSHMLPNGQHQSLIATNHSLSETHQPSASSCRSLFEPDPSPTRSIHHQSQNITDHSHTEAHQSTERSWMSIFEPDLSPSGHQSSFGSSDSLFDGLPSGHDLGRSASADCHLPQKHGYNFIRPQSAPNADPITPITKPHLKPPTLSSLPTADQTCPVAEHEDRKSVLLSRIPKLSPRSTSPENQKNSENAKSLQVPSLIKVEKSPETTGAEEDPPLIKVEENPETPDAEEDPPLIAISEIFSSYKKTKSDDDVIFIEDSPPAKSKSDEKIIKQKPLSARKIKMEHHEVIDLTSDDEHRQDHETKSESPSKAAKIVSKPSMKSPTAEEDRLRLIQDDVEILLQMGIPKYRHRSIRNKRHRTDNMNSSEDEISGKKRRCHQSRKSSSEDPVIPDAPLPSEMKEVIPELPQNIPGNSTETSAENSQLKKRSRLAIPKSKPPRMDLVYTYHLKRLRRNDVGVTSYSPQFLAKNASILKRTKRCKVVLSDIFSIKSCIDKVTKS